MYEVESCIRGFHVYHTVWRPCIGEELDCVRESGNSESATIPLQLQLRRLVKQKLPITMQYLNELGLTNGMDSIPWYQRRFNVCTGIGSYIAAQH